MIKKLLANPCSDYLSLQVCPMMLSRRRSSLYLWREMHWHGIGYVMIRDLRTINDWSWNFTRSSILCILFIMIVIIYIIFGLAKEKESLKLEGGLSQCYIMPQSWALKRNYYSKNLCPAFSQQSLHARYFLYWLFYDEDYWIQMGFIGKN